MPTLDDNRRLPLCSIRIYDPGAGDPVVGDHGDGTRYDILAQTARFGSSSVNSDGEPLLEYQEGIGLVCRPFLTPQDTRLSNWSTSGGSWEEQRPATGSPRHYQLVQYDTSANLAWKATSGFQLPQNPDIALSFLFVDAPADNNASLFPPYIRVEFAGAWGVEISKEYGHRLVWWNSATASWQGVLELSELVHIGNQDNGECVLFLRCLRGKIGVSGDFGKEYKWFAWPNGTNATIPQGTMVVRGQGGMIVFGLHQLLYSTGTFTAAQWNTFTSGARSAPTITGTTVNPAGTSVSFANNQSGTYAGYKATLTPHQNLTVGPPGWQVYSTPVLAAVTYEFPIVVQPWSNGQTYTELAAKAYKTVDIDKPLERGDATLTAEVRLDPSQPFAFNYGRWFKVVCLLGHVDNGGGENWTTAFTGYGRNPSVDWSEYGTLTFSFTADGPALPFKRAKWSNTFRVPLSNRTVNQAMDYLLYTEGRDPAAYRVWHPAGDAVFLYPGQPENPFEYPAVGEDKWSTLQRLAGYAGLEVVPLDDGTFVTLPKNYVSPAITDIWAAVPTSDLRALILKARYGYDSGESQTAVQVTGVDQWGQQVMGWAVDAAAEANPLSGKFCPWRELCEEELPGTATASLLATRVQSLAVEKFLLKQEGLITAPVNLTVSRGDRGQIDGTPLGIDGTETFAVMTLHHHYENDPSFVELRTEAGLRRVS